MSAKEFFDLFLKNKVLLWSLILANIGGTIFGFYYYQIQFASLPVWLWPLVPDSPLATILFASSLAYFAFGKKFNDVLNYFAFFGLVKVGIWTLLTMFLYRFYFFSPDVMIYYSILFVLHLGMIIEAFVLWKHLKFNKLVLILVTGWFLLNDFSDYLWGTVPTPVGTLGHPGLLTILGIESLLATIGLGVVILLFRKNPTSFPS